MPFSCVVAGCGTQFGPDGDAVPYRLSCGDVVCAGCWDACQSSKQCPVCGLAGAQLEFVDEALALASTTRVPPTIAPSSQSLFCIDCKLLEGRNTFATHACECDEGPLLCEHHAGYHTRIGHTPLPLEPLSDAAADVKYCSSHPDRKLELVCLFDQSAVCSLCAVAHANSGHSVKPADEATPALASHIAAAVSSLDTACGTFTQHITTIAVECDVLLATVAGSQATADKAYAALYAAIDAHKAASLRGLHEARDKRVKALSLQSTVLQNGLSQVVDGIALGRAALEAHRPHAMLSTLRSLKVLSRIPVRRFTGPCASSALTLDIDTSCVSDALRNCSALRLVRPGCSVKLSPHPVCCQSSHRYALCPGIRSSATFSSFGFCNDRHRCKGGIGALVLS